MSLTLEQRIEDKIAFIQAIEKDIPAVLIIHDIKLGTVRYMSTRGLNILGTTLKELQELGVDYYARYFNQEEAKEYVPKILALLERNNTDETISFYQQVRSAPDKDWTWYLSATKIFMRDDEGKPILTITTATPVDPKHNFSAKVQRLLDENNFLRHNQHLFSKLTSREIELLRLFALGKSAPEVSKELFISELTVKTHRRNLREKLNAESNYDLTRFAQAFDLI
jgi:DNA-binding CsgD family transcriptional regulator